MCEAVQCFESAALKEKCAAGQYVCTVKTFQFLMWIDIPTFSVCVYIAILPSNVTVTQGSNGYKSAWPESASELYRLSDRCLSAKLVPTFADRGCHMVSVTDPYGRILGFLDRTRYFLSNGYINLFLILSNHEKPYVLL
jgi:hypothetical protein